VFNNRPRLFRNSAAAPSVVRRYVGETLHDLPPDVVEPVTLMVSELASNCVQHASSDFTVSIERTDRHIRVDVADRGAGGVALRDPLPTEASGRGLRIVEQLADSWGVEDSVGRDGKDVWFVVNLPALGF
jgi:anti-sigma regulatory factor (Ser/Thr protein kinase)